MYTFKVILAGMILGIAVLVATNYFSQIIKLRVNSGQKITFDGKVIGHVVVCRYNGLKKFFYVDHELNFVNSSFYERKDVIRACRKAYIETMTVANNSRPRSLTFPRA